MRKMETSTVDSSLNITRNTPSKGGWKVREWKSQPSIKLKPSKNRHNREIVLRGAFRQTNIDSAWAPRKPSPRRKQTARYLECHEESPRHRLRKRIAFGLSACAGAVIIALVMSSNLQQRNDLWNAAGMAKAEAHPANEAQLPVPNKSNNIQSINEAEQPVPIESYQIQLGSYDKETSARYAWAILRAELGELLEGLEPYFENVQNGEGSLYRILAGTIPELNDADRLCTRLDENGIPCVIVEQQMSRISSR